MELTSLSLVAETTEEPEVKAYVFVATISAARKSESVIFGVKWWLGVWGMGILTIIIPLVHFLSVPISLLIGPVVGWKMYQQRSTSRLVRSGDFSCPKCAKSLSPTGRVADWPISLKCPSCDCKIEIKLKV